MANKISDIFEKIDSQNLESRATDGDVDIQYKLGMDFYDSGNYQNAEYWLEKAAKNKNIDAKRKEKIKRILNRKEFENLYPNNSPVPYAKSHMTSGGNAPRGSWSEWNY
mgnify:CR=1 FL=1